MKTRKLTTEHLGCTCDWGGCGEEAVRERFSDEHGWLPVCARHAKPGLKTNDTIEHVADLKPGDLVKNRHNGEVYLVAHNYGQEVILVLTKRVREGDGHNWRLHHRPKEEDRQLMIPAPAAWQGESEDIYDDEEKSYAPEPPEDDDGPW